MADFPVAPMHGFGITRRSALWLFARDRTCCVVSVEPSFLIRELQIVFRLESGSIPALVHQTINCLK